MRSLNILILAAFGLTVLSFVAPALAPKVAHAYPPYDLIVINDTDSKTIVKFYATRSERNGWGRDHFGNDILESGYQAKINLADGTGACVFDLKAVMDDGEEVIRYGLNVCTTRSWRIYTRRR